MSCAIRMACCRRMNLMEHGADRGAAAVRAVQGRGERYRIEIDQGRRSQFRIDCFSITGYRITVYLSPNKCNNFFLPCVTISI